MSNTPLRSRGGYSVPALNPSTFGGVPPLSRTGFSISNHPQLYHGPVDKDTRFVKVFGTLLQRV